ncbi:Glycosyltransferase involved in cell wall bisynthesis [Actinacidiphila alni]|uniref:D-inositol 3-phosphate glycosyltransferase n=1 Tax=Actinacidiphila alni TaxID=380248 RepID=A0A1I2JWB5_9ACTN|nr:glycosyltransferase [Actinacidiphila alni]SFF59132.1 Glycosyltransferase involved in cell wall bisynthesis [Actinacidiphila alni]
MTYTYSARGRIAMVSEHASPLAALGGPDAGGQNVYVARLAEQLAARGHEVTVYTRRDDPELPERMTIGDGVRLVHVTAGPATHMPKDELLCHMPEFGDRLAAYWHEERPDVAHAHFWMSGTAALAGAAGLGVPVVQTFHALGTVKRRYQGAADTSPAERIAVERRIGRECARVLATCSDEVAELGAMGVPENRISVVPCGVDPADFAPVIGRRSDTARAPDRDRRRQVLTVGRLVPRKGFDRAIRAMAEIPDAELLIAGGPAHDLLFADPEAERLRKIAADFGVEDRVRLLGGVDHDDMPRLMSEADLVLSVPSYEPFGIVPIEAMACRTPVVATAVGGQLDTVVDGVTGTWVGSDAEGGAVPGGRGGDSLGRVVRDLLGDPARLARYGAAGRRRVLGHYTWSRVADGIAGVYGDVSGAPSLAGGTR